VEAVRKGFDKTVLDCLLRLATTYATARRDYCLRRCFPLARQCDVEYTIIEHEANRESVKSFQGYNTVIKAESNMSQASFSEFVLYSELEPIFAAIGGSLGKTPLEQMLI